MLISSRGSHRLPEDRPP